MRPSFSSAFVSLALLLAATSCSPAISPRTGDTAPAGKFGWSVHTALWNFGWGHFKGPGDENGVIRIVFQQQEFEFLFHYGCIGLSTDD